MRPAPPRRPIVGLLIALVIGTMVGCHSVQVWRTSALKTIGDRATRPLEVFRRDDLEAMVLDREGLEQGDSDSLAAAFDRDSDPETALVLAERTFREARAANGIAKRRSLVLYRNAAVYASLAIGGSAPIESRAIAVHNEAITRLLRGVQGRHIPHLSDRTTGWREALAQIGIQASGPAPLLDPARITGLTPAADYRVLGLDHQFGSPGLGVPVVAHRPNDRDQPRDPMDPYFPEEGETPATAVLRVGPPGSGPSWRGRALTLDLADPFEARSAIVGSKVVPLATDRTTSLAAQAWRGQSLQRAGFRAALSSDLGEYEEGLSLLQPYRPGKIPVVLVHGLLASPVVWAETLNELSNDPTIADRYQFWFFFYASGEPIPLAAEKLREALREARATFDPSGTEPALDRMVLVGHSQGGLLAKILAQESGLTIWDAALKVRYPASRISPESQALLEKALIFHPEPYVRRIVFIATPHSGSPVADGALGRVGLLISRPQADTKRIDDELKAAYGPRGETRGIRGESFSLNNLRPSSQVIRGLRAIPLDPSVPHHSIILQMKHPTPHGRGDGLVPYDSAHLDSAQSEVIVQGTHLDQDSPGVTDELRRILRLHASEVGFVPSSEPEPNGTPAVSRTP